MSDLTITEMRRDTNGMYGDGIFAAVKTADGATLLLSQLDGEEHWVADGMFGANGFPHWCHGFGSRCTLLKVVSDAGLLADLAARAALLAGYDAARRSHGDSYADYLIAADAEHAAKGFVPRPWPLSLQGNDGD